VVLVKIAITGGTGFVGSHVVAEALAAGHEVRLLARSPSKVERLRTTHHIADDAPIEVVDADLEDHASLQAGMDGCDAIVHAAALFSLDPRQADAMERINPSATSAIVVAGQELGLDPIVYVSTMGVYQPPPADHITAELDMGPGCGPYTRSKIEAERKVRAAQADGVPVVSVYPGGIFGPRDPNQDLSDSVAVVRDIMLGKMPTIPKHAAMPFVDVRDVAKVLVGALEPGHGPRRYLMAGEQIELRELVRICMSLTGRRLPLFPASKKVLQLTGRVADRIAERTGKTMPFSAETVDLMAVGIDHPNITYDQSPAERDFGMPATAMRDTIRDTLLWLVEAGHLTPAKIGHLAG